MVDMKETILIKGNSFEKIKKEINLNFGKKIIFTSNDDDLNRKVIEKLLIDVLLINLEGRKDFQKQRNSGFNQVLAKICQKNKVKIGINLDEIINSSVGHRPVYPKEGRVPLRGLKLRNSGVKAEILARVRQNVKLCNKNKIDMVFVAEKHKRNIHDLKAFGLVLGMPTWMTKNLQTFFN